MKPGAELEAAKTQGNQKGPPGGEQTKARAQEIAGLLGETTAETKVSLLRLLEMLGREKG